MLVVPTASRHLYIVTVRRSLGQRRGLALKQPSLEAFIAEGVTGASNANLLDGFFRGKSEPNEHQRRDQS